MTAKRTAGRRGNKASKAADDREWRRAEETVRLRQQESAILEATELVCRLMGARGVGRRELSRRAGVTKGDLDRLLDGRAEMTLRTLSDILAALDAAPVLSAGRAAIPDRVRAARDEPQGCSAMFCEHANEVPASCPCRPDCYCRTRGSCVDADDPLDREIDLGSLRGGVRGKYYARMKEGTNIVLLAPDVHEHFRDSDSVNDVLRRIIRIGFDEFPALFGAGRKRPARRPKRRRSARRP